MHMEPTAPGYQEVKVTPPAHSPRPRTRLHPLAAKTPFVSAGPSRPCPGTRRRVLVSSHRALPAAPADPGVRGPCVRAHQRRGWSRAANRVHARTRWPRSDVPPTLNAARVWCAARAPLSQGGVHATWAGMASSTPQRWPFEGPPRQIRLTAPSSRRRFAGIRGRDPARRRTLTCWRDPAMGTCSRTLPAGPLFVCVRPRRARSSHWRARARAASNADGTAGLVQFSKRGAPTSRRHHAHVRSSAATAAVYGPQRKVWDDRAPHLSAPRRQAAFGAETGP